MLQMFPVAQALPRPAEIIRVFHRLELSILPLSSVPITQTPITVSALQNFPDTEGVVHTSLETSGEPSSLPFRTSVIPSASPTIRTTGASAIPTSSSVLSAPSSAATAPVDVFQSTSNNDLPSNIPSRADHPVPKLGINQSGPIHTNKFYANFFLGGQNQPTFTHPYSLAWSKGNGNAQSWGLSISHTDESQIVYGPPNSAISGSPASFYINPLGIQSLILSAAELGASTVLTTDTLQAFSVNVNLQPSVGSAGRITFPLVQGMGFVTAIYTGLQPAIQSSVFFKSVVAAGSPKPQVYKYRCTLEDNTLWLIYAISANGVDPNLNLVSTTLLAGPKGFQGVIQIAKNPSGATAEQMYDSSAGVYATAATITGSVLGSTGTYSLGWTKGGAQAGTSPLVMFALPHHVQSFDPTTKTHLQNTSLHTTTKGVATAVVADGWTMQEVDLPIDMGFAPWNPVTRSASALSPAAKAVIAGVSASEVSQNMTAQTNLDSFYFSGKGLAKFAAMIYTINDLQQNPSLAAAGLTTLKRAFDVWVQNRQKYRMVYDTVWKGVVSEGSYLTADSGLDFGNTYYNDHHFHYGYFIYTAAVIGYLDPFWLKGNQDWVNTLVRDVANPSTQDPLFPFSRSNPPYPLTVSIAKDDRSFDFFHGHSWAKGLFESGDGKDEESSSEDTMFAYALKMWGRSVGDKSMEARGNLMLSILARSLQNYFLFDSTNKNVPASFAANKVSGILFENKVDHATYFGLNLEYIQGIHMIPLVPSSALIRQKQFVQEEWDAMFAANRVADAEKVVGGWRGILYANLAIIDPKTSWNFFAQPNFDNSFLDGGASRTWYLAYAAGLGGAPS